MTERKNSFKELEKIEMEDISMRKDVIRRGIDSDIGIIRYFTSVIELYFPKVLDLLLMLFGEKSIGNETDNKSK